MGTITLLDYYRMLKARGWKYPAQYFIQSHLFDLLRGTNTHFWVPHEEYQRQNSASEDSIHYVACPTHTIRKCLAAIHTHAGDEFGKYQFLDLGCGKGKALLVYAEYSENFKPPLALGIEMVDALAATARKNIAIRKETERLKIFTDTATNWREHSDSEYMIIFLYNPFGAKTLQEVISKVKLIKKCYVAYVDPEHSALFGKQGWNKIHEAGGEYKNDHIEIWYQGHA